MHEVRRTRRGRPTKRKLIMPLWWIKKLLREERKERDAENGEAAQ